MAFNVLVVDDEIGTREDDYKYFSKCFVKDTKHKVNFTYVYHPRDIVNTLNEKYFDAIVSDVVLDKTLGWEGFTLDSLFTILRDSLLQDIPLLLVSNVWNITNSDLINRALNQQQWKGFIHYRDICKDQKGDVGYPISQLLGVLKKTKNIGSLSQKVSNDADVRILHLSDLQHGGFTDADLQSRTQLAIDEILTYWKQKPPHFICISGDITEHGLPEEYEKASLWLKDFAKQLNKPMIYCVPGNHDVCVPLAGATRLSLDKDSNGKKEIVLSPQEQILHPALFRYSITPFKDYWSSFSDIEYLDDTLPSAPWVDSRFRHIGLIFCGFNTAIPNAVGLPNRTACPTALNLITNELKEVQKRHPHCCTICVMHHSPVPVPDAESIDNVSNFELAFKGSIRTNIICHGHQHTWKVKPQHFDKYSMLISQAATFNKSAESRPEDSLRGFNLLTLKRKDNVVDTVKAATCNFDAGDFFCRNHDDIEDYFKKNILI